MLLRRWSSDRTRVSCSIPGPGKVLLGTFRLFEHFSVVAWSLELCPKMVFNSLIFPSLIVWNEANFGDFHLDLLGTGFCPGTLTGGIGHGCCM
uniref:SFRICE_000654 n=1 Tax=Spodoptera frugiperda TaxID=7108 RepID=A0A2H1WG09_SPOFR